MNSHNNTLSVLSFTYKLLYKKNFSYSCFSEFKHMSPPFTLS